VVRRCMKEGLMARYDPYNDYLREQDPNADNAPSTVEVCPDCGCWWHEGGFPEHREGCPQREYHGP
jgi:hypothetical protein